MTCSDKTLQEAWRSRAWILIVTLTLCTGGRASYPSLIMMLLSIICDEVEDGCKEYEDGDNIDVQ